MKATKSPAILLIWRILIVGILAIALLATADIVWPRVSFWHEQGLAVRLVADLEAAAAANYRSTLRRIASLGDPAIEALVVAAASERAEISLLAREIIEERLAAWKIRPESQGNFDAARSVGLLAQALAKHVGSFGSYGQQWAQRLSLELVDATADFPADQVAAILADCSAVMEAVPALGPIKRIEANEGQLATDERKRGALPDMQLPPWQGDTGGASRADEKPDTNSSGTTADGNSVNMEGLLHSTPLPADSGWIPEWTPSPSAHDQPVSLKPDRAIEYAVPESEDVADVPSPDEMAAKLQEFRQYDTRSLLVRLTRAARYEAGIIRAALLERGIGAEELPLATRLLAEDSSDRLKLVDDLKVLPARTARRWLRELLKDSDSDVRFQALTALATTNDPGLTAIARELAVRDPDARVSKLAARIVRGGAGF